MFSTAWIILATIAAYFCLLLLISWRTGRKADNAGFFTDSRLAGEGGQITGDALFGTVAWSEKWFGGYQISFELIIINALITALGLCLLARRGKRENGIT